MVALPTGNFMMGSTPDEKGRDPDEEPRHRRNVEERVALGESEVTRGEFPAFVDDTRYKIGTSCWVHRDGRWVESAAPAALASATGTQR